MDTAYEVPVEGHAVAGLFEVMKDVGSAYSVSLNLPPDRPYR